MEIMEKKYILKKKNVMINEKSIFTYKSKLIELLKLNNNEFNINF
jgi:hypothetical protein